MDQPVERSGEVLIVTGMSGAGRSTVANALEDLDWYVVDNLPPQMLRPLLDLSGLGAMPRVAAVVDVRGRNLFSTLPDVMHQLRDRSDVRVVFLDAADDVLVRRFEAVRRPHPLQGQGTILDGIHRERERSRAIREASDIVIDTSNYNVHQLVTHVGDLFSEAGSARHTLTVMSFGFKYGVPTDTDFVADMRFLPNPFWIERLRPLTGEDPEVSEYVLSQPGAMEFIDAYQRAITIAVEGFQRENKSHSTVAIGCTGGKHRSVATAIELATRLSGIPDVAVRVKHRDRGRE
ncbi:RNase adapter RapZ [Microbacterium gorillae]|uniref:RNase adapter RapZ n=1 Tax=Microbacterium gorillae TaxID=1231063 RepID=UPI00058CADA9|nr:RNase adapter RapZ [Microbacterium gorillae]